MTLRMVRPGDTAADPLARRYAPAAEAHRSTERRFAGRMYRVVREDLSRTVSLASKEVNIEQRINGERDRVSAVCSMFDQLNHVLEVAGVPFGFDNRDADINQVHVSSVAGCV